jgi:KTSC domain
VLRRVVHSEGLISVGYDAGRSELEIELARHYVYRYHGVPHDLYERLLAAPSLGRFFNENIRDAFPCTRINEPRPR